MQTTTGNDRTREVLEAYLPRTLIEHWSAAPFGADVWQERLSGTLMLCDMSGFTAMSERLARLGNEGAELMAGVLNGFFDRMIRIADGWGGVQMKFGGDAMLLFFGGDEHAPRAAACALDMQRVMPEFADVPAGGETHRLRMRVGIHSGSFFSASVGIPEGVLHYLLMGPDVSRTAATEGAAEPEQVVASAEAAALLPRADTFPARDGCVQVTSLDQPPRPADKPDVSRAPSNVLVRYVLPPLATPLAEGRVPEFLAEHRRVTAVFINVIGMADLLARDGDAEALNNIDAYLKLVLANLEKHGGFLGGSDAAETGDKLIVLFGAPTASERDEVSAMRFALDLNANLRAARLPFKHRIGISTGFVFAGEVGSGIRREYTVIGDSVNLAARLMTAAKPGQVFVSTPTVERSRDEFELHKLRPLSLKGKSLKIQAYRLDAARAVRQAKERAASNLMGRAAETASLVGLAREARDGMRLAFVSGAPGIGKSALLEDLTTRLDADGWRVLAGYCAAHYSRTVFAAWVEPLRELLGIAHMAGAEAWLCLRNEVARLRPDLVMLAPLLAEMLALPSDDEPMLRFLDARARRDRLTALVTGVLEASARERPVALYFDDVHQSDGPSMALLAQVLPQLSGEAVFVLLSSRNETLPGEFDGVAPSLVMPLGELALDDARRLLTSVTDLGDAELDAIVARAQGNPLFLHEMALRGGTTSGESMPQNINEVIVSRLDHLPDGEKAVIRTASVVGSSFDRRHVAALLEGRFDFDAVDAALAQLAVRGFTRETDDENATHAFCHGLAQEVIYETLPYAQRRVLHHTVGGIIETEHADQLPAFCGVLLHHFERAQHGPQTVTYAAMSGDRAATVFATAQAVDYFGRALAVLENMSDDRAPERSLLLERIGDSLETEGRHRAATEAFEEALVQWRARTRTRAMRLLAPETADAVREAELCRRVAISHERRSNFDEALRWLDDALGVLPVRSGRVGADVAASKCLTLFRRGEYPNAITWGRRALNRARRTKDRRAVAFAQNMLGNAYVAQGALRKAIRYFRPAVDLYDEIVDVPRQAAAHNNLGISYQDLGMLDLALQEYTRALEADERVGDRVDALIIHNNIGEVLLFQGRLDDAAGHFREVIEGNDGDADLTAVAGLSHVNLCRAAMARGDLVAAEEEILRGMKLLASVGAKGLLSEARIQLAELRLAQGRLNEALREGRAALVEVQVAEARLLEARAGRVLGCIHAALGSSREGFAMLGDSAALAARIGADLEEARAHAAFASLSIQHGDRGAAARSRLAGAFETFLRLGATLEAEACRHALGELEAVATDGGAAR